MHQPSRNNNTDFVMAVSTVWERDEARWIAANIAKLQALLCSGWNHSQLDFFAGS
jgi:hypothetical protein